ncbi:transcriptional attenuator, LytR family [Hathewaya proteolytica DSM 3090]|uniref:Transcriptional attenuator, LytR family n=1 Tax=Hathewaya proteolytica DSM 3090 TaxID=1121331 RepID=A0A1M6JQD7_9CLOT|nr:LCP family protein [Hathewaya proteolytica]SHJ48884.1 transcriptional attenuator, LytR family [Hathewaya proteolytica DSM 3090]
MSLNLCSKFRKKPTIFKVLVILIFLILFSFFIIMSYSFILFNKMNNIPLDNKELSIVPQKELEKFEDHKSIKNIALFGIDANDGHRGRSDSIMIATIDEKHDKVKITSIMRDSYVNIPGHGMDKINHAYAFGGPTLAIKTLNENFGLNIEDFLSVNFSSLPKIIDSMGGINIPIIEEEIKHIPGLTKPGDTLLNGAQALAYCRIRHATGGDYERTHRHRTVMSAIYAKALKASPTSYPSLLNDMLPLVQTNLTYGEFLSLGTKLFTLQSHNLQQERFPRDGQCKGDMSTGIYYLKFDIPTVKTELQEYLFNDKK